MEKNKSVFKIGDFVKKQKKKGIAPAKPINLEALVNSGRVRIQNDILKEIPYKADKSE
jgi:hypothetical protein